MTWLNIEYLTRACTIPSVPLRVRLIYCATFIFTIIIIPLLKWFMKIIVLYIMQPSRVAARSGKKRNSISLAPFQLLYQRIDKIKTVWTRDISHWMLYQILDHFDWRNLGNCPLSIVFCIWRKQFVKNK